MIGRIGWHWAVGAAGLCLAVLLCVPEAEAQSVFEKLVMPGPLIEGHAKLEKDCSNCHEAFSKKSQMRLCLACHKKINADREKRRGFHGRRPDAVSQPCKNCHTDHVGRTADVAPLDKDTFRHDLTDFQLAGAHAALTCNQCHRPKVKYRDVPASCVKCHKTDEPHKGRLGEDCQNCHEQSAWLPPKPFDHSKTKFNLRDAHQDVACKACHAGERYTDIPKNCVNCHDIQDFHLGKFGARCETCHAPKKWEATTFDHARDTKYALKGKHSKLRCVSCHQGDLYKVKLSNQCVACHKADDPHKGQLGDKCERCHNATNWRRNVLFDHELTRFPLLGRHVNVKCQACHKSRSFKNASRQCESCHEDRHHSGRLGARCASCHVPTDWKKWRFDHNRQTQFRLTGAHERTHCHGCHKVKNAKKVTAPNTCIACHERDDIHRGAFGQNCARCHTTTNFLDGVRRR